MNFNEKMRYLREKKGLTQEEVAREIRISVSSIKNYEHNRLADTYTLKLIRQYYNVPYEFLLDDTCINENEDNILTGKALNLSDTSINKLKEINSVAQNNVTDNFIKKTSITFWDKLDEYLTLFKKRKELNLLKERITGLTLLVDYTTKDSLDNYVLFNEEEHAHVIYRSKFYEKNTTEYDIYEKNKALKALKELRNICYINAFHYAKRITDPQKNFSPLDEIEKYIQNNSLIPINTINELFCFIDLEIQELNEKSEKVRSNIIKNFSNYLNTYK